MPSKRGVFGDPFQKATTAKHVKQVTRVKAVGRTATNDSQMGGLCFFFRAPLSGGVSQRETKRTPPVWAPILNHTLSRASKGGLTS